jgi:hypothetical protein
VLSILWGVSVNFTVCCLWSRHVGSRSRYLILLVLGNGLISDGGSRFSIHFSGEGTDVCFWLVGIRGRDSLFGSEKMIKIAKFWNGFGGRRSMVGIVVMVLTRDNILETFPRVIFVGCLIEVVNSRVGPVIFLFHMIFSISL